MSYQHIRSAAAMQRRAAKWSSGTEVRFEAPVVKSEGFQGRRIIQEDSTGSTAPELIKCHLTDRLNATAVYKAPQAAPLCKGLPFEEWMYTMGDPSKGRSWNVPRWAQWRKRNNLLGHPV